ncbi:unnamed protein product, partial [Ceratitis capitata]
SLQRVSNRRRREQGKLSECDGKKSIAKATNDFICFIHERIGFASVSVSVSVSVGVVAVVAKSLDN